MSDDLSPASPNGRLDGVWRKEHRSPTTASTWVRTASVMSAMNSEEDSVTSDVIVVVGFKWELLTVGPPKYSVTGTKSLAIAFTNGSFASRRYSTNTPSFSVQSSTGGSRSDQKCGMGNRNS